MKLKTLAHLSDLHLGQSSERHDAAQCVVNALLASEIDHVIVTGDMTHRGRESELEIFKRLFRPLQDMGRLTYVPGNHDRVGDFAWRRLMENTVEVVENESLYVVKIDSTAYHNTSFFRSHGQLLRETVETVISVVRNAPANRLVVLAMHHHPIPLPEESFGERYASFMGWPHARELELGTELIARILGHCDLVLHGHRHVPHQWVLSHDSRPLWVLNAGSTSELRDCRILPHADGALAGPIRWLGTGASSPNFKQRFKRGRDGVSATTSASEQPAASVFY